MTYKELYEKAASMLDRGEITLGDFDKMVKPLDVEIQPEPHWIPVEQDTPTEDDDYWCTFDAETGRFVDWCSWYQGRWMVWTDDTVSEVSNVIAWCKPMEPYKGG